MTLLNELRQFTGTENYYRYFGGLNLTDGVKYLADKAQCYWLLDIIASYQPKLLKCPFQVWTLKKTEGSEAIVTCEDGNGKHLIRQKIPFTDFPLAEISLYCTDKVLLLPSEY